MLFPKDLIEIAVLGETGVGKTCFIDMLRCGMHFAYYTATYDEGHLLTVDNEPANTYFIDLSSTVIREAGRDFSPDFFQRRLRRADGVILLYDVTNLESFEQATNHAYMYVWLCKNYLTEYDINKEEGFECVLVANKVDLLKNEPQKRAVDRNVAEEWARSQGFKHFEINCYERSEVTSVAEALVRSIRKAKKLKNGDVKEQKNGGQTQIGKNTDSKKFQWPQGSSTSFRQKIKQALITHKRKRKSFIIVPPASLPPHSSIQSPPSNQT